MGVHHYPLELRPRASSAAARGDVVWIEQPSESLLRELRALLPNETSWGGVEEFASERHYGSDLRIWHEDERTTPVRSIVLRFSPVADGLVLLERFLELAVKHDLIVYSGHTERPLEPQIDDVIADMKGTPAFRFLSDQKAAILQAAAQNARANSSS